jgi:hypothetical protein
MNHRKWLRLKETLLESAHNNFTEDGVNEDMEQGWEKFQCSSLVEEPQKKVEDFVVYSCRMVSNFNVGADKTLRLLFLLPFDSGLS